jgi:protein TonB
MESKAATAPSFARRKKDEREVRAQRLRQRVSAPVKPRPEPRTANPGPVGRTAKGLSFALAAVLVHGAVVGVLALTGGPGEMPVTDPMERVLLQTRVMPAPVAAAVEEAMAQEVTAEESPALPAEPELRTVREPLPVNKPVKRQVAQPAPPADPVDVSPAAEPAPERRRIVGISLSSTVQAGAGPSFAVGNTRMGETGAVAESPKDARALTGVEDGTPGARSGEQPAANRVATIVPTAAATFVKPRRISEGSLDYPADLKSRGIEGNVVVLIVIDTEGRVQKVRIIQSSGYPQFDEAAQEAALREMYQPAMRDGMAVEYNLKYTYRFRIRGA